VRCFFAAIQDFSSGAVGGSGERLHL
jgi:hypothetical protein